MTKQEEPLKIKLITECKKCGYENEVYTNISILAKLKKWNVIIEQRKAEEIKELIEDKFFNGWEDLYGDMLSRDYMVLKEEWEQFWEKHIGGKKE